MIRLKIFALLNLAILTSIDCFADSPEEERLKVLNFQYKKALAKVHDNYLKELERLRAGAAKDQRFEDLVLISSEIEKARGNRSDLIQLPFKHKGKINSEATRRTQFRIDVGGSISKPVDLNVVIIGGTDDSGDGGLQLSVLEIDTERVLATSFAKKKGAETLSARRLTQSVVIVEVFDKDTTLVGKSAGNAYELSVSVEQ